jgi:hypothetical protein
MRSALGVMAVVLASCGGGGSGSSVACDEDGSCAFGESCVEGVCVEASCNTSIQCPMEHYCGNGRTCEPGCEDNDDCYPGDRCDIDLGSCVSEGCNETAVDCGFREFCNVANGECYDAGNQYCQPCSDDDECGDGNFCWAGYCGVDCTYNECPGGFQCYPVDSYGNITALELGNVFTYQCLTYCWLYEDYDPGSFLVGEDGAREPWPTLPTSPAPAAVVAP